MYDTNQTFYSLADVRSTQLGTTFVVTNDAFEWVPLSLFFTGMYLTVFFQVPQVKTSYKQMAAISLVTSLILVTPFLSYFMTGISWTGMNLSEVHKRMIDSRHAVLMSLWMVFSIIQLTAYIFKKQAIHNRVGGWVVNYLLPLIFMELFGNAVFVFWPEKPHALATGVYSAKGWPIPESHHDMSIYETVVFTLPSLMALSTPVTMVMYYWLSNQALDRTNGKKRNIRLHVVYMCCFLYATLAAGTLRWVIKQSFKSSECVPQTDNAIAALMQFRGEAWGGFVYTALLTAIYLTLPLETRRNDAGVKWSYLAYMLVSSLITPIAGWWAGFPQAIKCV